jgi:uncharacterized repeat protein (TIGR02543 family)
MLSLQKTNHKISHLFGYIFTGLFFTFCGFGGINAANATCTTGQLDINGDGTECVNGKFAIKTTNLNAGDTFKFSLSAAGAFTVDCGVDGALSGNAVPGGVILRNDTTNTVYTCTYSTGGAKTIVFDGTATNYNNTYQDSSNNYYAAITFSGTNADNTTETLTPTKIASVSGNLSAIFPYISGNSASGAQPRFYRLFNGATNLTTVPDTLFANYTTGATKMFRITFGTCTGLTSIPAGLFSGIKTGATYMFDSTFYGCTGLTSIPADLFSGITTGASDMFHSTFYGCTGLTSIPAGLFSGITTGATYMFLATFYNCTGLTSIPADLFSGITTGENYMFWSTFFGCTNLTGYIPPSTFAGLIANGSPTAGDMWMSAFGSPKLATSCPAGTVQFVTGYESRWNGKVSCVPDADADIVTYSCGDGTGTPPADQGAISGKPFVLPTNTCTKSGYNFAGWAVSGTNDVINDRFTWNYSGNKTLTAQWMTGKFEVTTTNLDNNDTFKFSLSAAGTFTVDCGENGTLTSTADDVTNGNTITRNNVDQTTYTCTYTTGGVKTIGFDGTATGYSANTTAAIAFCLLSNNVETLTPTKIASVAGNLSTIFPYKSAVVVSGGQPRFVHTFRGATNLTTVPDTLFANYTKASSYMFPGTFRDCTSLTSIPAGLFSGITTGAAYMFQSTFLGTGLTSIPAGLFSGLTTSDIGMFQGTFFGCGRLTTISGPIFSGLTSVSSGVFQNMFRGTALTEIPSDLFSNITTVSDRAFDAMFMSTKLTSIHEGLFANITNAAQGAFQNVFLSCPNLSGYIPPSTFAGLIANGSPTAGDMWLSAFGSTKLATSCPAGTKQYLTGYEGSGSTTWNGRVSCVPDAEADIVTYSCGDGTGTPPADQGAISGKPFVLPTNTCTKSGYNFAGWAVSGTNDVINDRFTWNYSGNKTLTAQWMTGKFEVTTTNLNDNDTFKFSLSAAGTFTVNCGENGTLSSSADDVTNGNTITRNNVTQATYTCTYTTGGVKNIAFDGTATNYSIAYQDSGNNYYAAIAFSGTNTDVTTEPLTPTKIASVAGNLSAIFPYLGTASGQRPRFYRTFSDATNLTTIPGTLFANYTKGVSNLFYQTFSGCTSLASIPANLFGAITTSAPAMFFSTFENCTALTTIPAGLFSHITECGASMFVQTFYGCTSLTTIPSDLFSGITTIVGNSNFAGAFSKCTSLITIPSGLFSNIKTSAQGMYSKTFYGCTSLTTIPSDLFSGITGVSYTMFSETFADCTALTTIPSGLFSQITTVSNSMGFWRTFSGCTSLVSIPANLFGGITTGAQGTFRETFAGCTSLTSIPAGLFKNITNGAEDMFQSAFEGCTSLVSIPVDLFGSITNGARSMFYATFRGCTGLTSIPAGLFSGITTAAPSMFMMTFSSCTKLSGYIHPSTFAGLIAAGAPITTMWDRTFHGTKLATSCPSGTMPYITGYEGNKNGDTWNGKVSCQEIVPVMCDAGKYLEADDVMCYDCTSNNYCPGGIYTYDGSDLGLTQCPNNWYSQPGAASTDQCGRILHIGDATVYLYSAKKTTPALHVQIGNDIFYGNATTADVAMNSGTQQKLKLQYNNTTYSIYDDSVELPTE